MPIPFDRFRLLNGSTKKVESAEYGTRPDAEHVDPDSAQNDAALGPIDSGAQAASLPIVFDVKTVIIAKIETELVAGKKRRLTNWEIFYPQDMVAFPEDNCILGIDVYVLNMPGDPLPNPNEFYAWAHVIFADGTTWDYYSSQFAEAD